MPYIGRDLNRGNYLKLDDISSSFNSSTKTFNLTVGGSAFTPGSAFSILVSVGGVIQEPESAYQVNNSEITFANAPTAQDSFFCIALGVALGIGVPGNGTVNGTQIAKPFNYDGFFYLNDASNRVGINSSIPTSALDVSGTIKASTFSGPVVGNTNNTSGISTFYDLRVSNNLTVEGTTSTLDTNLIGVDRVEVGANSNTIAGIAVTQSGTADLVRLYDGSTQVVTVTDTGDVGIGYNAPDTSYGTNLNVHSTGGNTGARIKLSDGTSGTGNVDGFDLLGINGRAYVINRENHEMYFSTNNLVRMRINAGGQVNIGNNITQTSKLFYVDGTSEFQGVTTHNDHVSIGVDSKKLRIGASNDLEIEHNGSDSYISSNTGNFVIQHSNNSGDLEIKANDFYVKSYANEKYIRAQADGAVELYHDNTKTFSTNSLGISVYQRLVCEGTAPSILLSDTNHQSYTITADANALTITDANNGNRLGFNANGSISAYGFFNCNNSVYAANGFSTNGNINIDDDGDKLRIGAGNDLQIYHSTFNYIESYNDAEIHINANTGGSVENMAKFKPNGAVELYHNGSKKLETTSSGVTVAGDVSIGNDTGKFLGGASNDIQLYHDGSNSVLDNLTGGLFIKGTGSTAGIQFQNRNGNESMAKFFPDGAVELYHNNVKKFETTANGADFTVASSGQVNLYGLGGTNGLRISGPQSASSAFLFFNTNHQNVSGGTDQYTIQCGGANHTLMFKHGNSTGNVVFELDDTEHVRIPQDNKALKIGAGQDLRLFHDGSHSFVQNTTGLLILQDTSGIYLRTDDLRLQSDGGSETYATLTKDGAVSLNFDNSTKLATTSSGVQVTGALNVTTTMHIPDGNVGLQFGNSNDMIAYHNGSNSFIQHQGTGSLYIDSLNNSADIYIRSKDNLHLMTKNNSDNSVVCVGNGGVILYNAGSQKFTTNHDGISVTGRADPAADSTHDLGTNATRWRTLYSDTINVSAHGGSANGTVANFRGGMYNQINIANSNNAGWGLLLTNTDQSTYGSNSGYHYSSNTSVNSPCAVVNVNSDALHFATGNASRWFITHGGHFLPYANNSYDIGSTSNKVRNIYTNDLHLSNEGSTNSVDNTWGDYTIQEGESDLFLINNRNGKKYKFNLTEVV